MNTTETPTSKFYGLFQYIFEYYNKTLFQNEIKDCIIVVIKKKNTFGHFAPKRWFFVPKKCNRTGRFSLTICKHMRSDIMKNCKQTAHFKPFLRP